MGAARHGQGGYLPTRWKCGNGYLHHEMHAFWLYGKGGNLQLMLGVGAESALLEKFFCSPQKLSFGRTNLHQCSVNKQIFFN